MKPEPHFYTGQEHGLIWQEYLSDDEFTADVDGELDAYAHQNWRETEAVYDEELYYASHPVAFDRFHY